MDIARTAELRPRFVWDIIDDAFDLYRERFWLLLTVTAAVYIPLCLAQFGATNLLTKSATDQSDYAGSAFGVVLLMLPLTWMANFLIQCAAALIVEAQFDGRSDITAAAVFRAIRPRTGALIGAMFIIALVNTIGLCTGGILTIFSVIGTVFVAHAIVIEKRRLGSAIKRSINLARYDSGRVLAIMLIPNLLTAMLSLGIGGAFQILLSLLPHGGAANAVTDESLKRTVTPILNGLTAILLGPIVAVATALLYYDLRVRREGIDLAAQTLEQGITLAADPFGDLPSARVVHDQRRRQGKARVR